MTPSSGDAEYPPDAFKPPTTGLAVGIAEFLVIDDAHERVFVRRGTGLDILALDAGAKTGRVELPWEAQIWPAGPNILALRASPAALDVNLVDPVAARIVASCSRSLQVPANSLVSRVDEFTTHTGTTYLKWETSPPPERHGGARMSDEELDKETKAFQAAYACGVLVVHVTGTTCRLDPVSFKEPGLESCETRTMPWPRYLPSPIGDLVLRVDRTTNARTGLIVDTETLVVSDPAGHERWRTSVDTRAIAPPAP